MRLSSGTRLGPYEILSLLGSGGMGEVYRARDPKLNRLIALKVLPETTAADPERRARFEREAQSIAALNHPNIVTIYSVEEVSGVLFFTMEYVEGQPLDDLIVKGGLPLARILALAIPVVDALSAVHQKGITHRDLKPANVMVTTDGRVKVLDFGLATSAKPSPVGADVTASTTRIQSGAGQLVGTVAYMSPEQAEGKPVAPRSDIFSLGVLLYELATGERPFTGETSVAVLSSILRDTPRAVTDLRPDLPRDLSRIIRHCLIKDPESRYQRAQDLRYELVELQQDSESGDLPVSRGAWAEARMPVSPAKRRTKIESLAVLPFVNVGADLQTEYLSDGITENLINSLSQLGKLRVLPRSTVFRYKGRNLDLPTLGRELAVRAVLTGRVVQRGDSLHIQIDLVDVTEDAQLWGHQYTRTFADLITVQEEIVKEVSDKLRQRPTPKEQKRLAQRFTENPAAHQLYLKGRFFWNRRTSQALHQATEYFQQAIDIDPGYGRAWAGLADSYALYSTYEAGSPREAGPRAKDAALKALQIDDTLAEAHTALGITLLTYDWDWSGAGREFQRAIALDPHDGVAHLRYGFYWLAMGRVEDALAAFKRAQALEPLSLIINSWVGSAFYWVRRYDRAIEEFRKTLSLDPNFVMAHLNIGWVYERQARYADAIAAFQKALTLFGGESIRIAAALAHTYAVAGQRGEAEQILETLKARSTQHYVDPFYIALIYLGLGAEGLFFEWLEKSYEDHSPWLFALRIDPYFDGIRDDPRCRDLLRRLRLLE